jgi:hypothetical protein
MKLDKMFLWGKNCLSLSRLPLPGDIRFISCLKHNDAVMGGKV